VDNRIRCALTYSWSENLFDLLKRMRENYPNQAVFIWVDILLIDQNSDCTKALQHLKNMYQDCTHYSVSSYQICTRYWCCFELSLYKNTKLEMLLNIDSMPAYKTIISKFWDCLEGCKHDLYNLTFDHSDDGYLKFGQKLPDSLLKFIKEVTSLNLFDIKNANISFESDRIYIDNEISKSFSTAQDYDSFVELTMVMILLQHPSTDLTSALQRFYFPGNQNIGLWEISCVERCLNNLKKTFLKPL